VAGAWTPPHDPTSRPALEENVGPLIIGLARDNPRWATSRSRANPQHLGIRVSATTIRTMLGRHGLDPAARRTDTTWRAFLRQQASGIVACDAITVDTVWLRRLQVGDRLACHQGANRGWRAGLALVPDQRRHRGAGQRRQR
jgi:putative transposase